MKSKSRPLRDGFAILLTMLREGLAYRVWLCGWTIAELCVFGSAEP